MGRMLMLVAAAGLVAAMSAPAAGQGLDSVLIENVPHVEQLPDFCGEACAAMALQKLGQPYTQQHVFDASRLSSELGRGCHTGELVNALRRIGFRVGAVWHRAAPNQGKALLEQQFERLRADLVRGWPSIVCCRYDDRREAPEHFRLVVGYDADRDEVIYHEPAEAGGAYRRMARSKFVRLWPLNLSARRLTVIRICLVPGRILEPVERKGFTAADFAQHVNKLNQKLKDKVPANRFTIVVQSPFVIIGDEKPRQVRRRATRTIKTAVDRLKKTYFEKEPKRIVDIYLFKDKASYEKHAKALFGRTPHTPFGYYSEVDDALVMNIATGGGTLVHEIVHPFVEANFPQCPTWFNEGLGSLYEQCRYDPERIIGLTNWRLAGLQKAIRAGQVPSFKHLTGTSSHEFYNMDRGTHYAQARYLCYYLQERDLLVSYYRQFRKNVDEDITGYATLQQILGEDDMAALQKRWEEWVLRLSFP